MFLWCIINPTKKMKFNKSTVSTLLLALASLGILNATPLSAQGIPGAAFQPPRAIFQPRPDYSYDLRHDCIEGRVAVSFTVTASGKVTDVAIASSTERRLDQPTLLAIKRWKFAPAAMGGLPIGTTVIETVNFTLSNSAG